jgi:hypothetical protein
VPTSWLVTRQLGEPVAWVSHSDGPADVVAALAGDLGQHCPGPVEFSRHSAWSIGSRRTAHSGKTGLGGAYVTSAGTHRGSGQGASRTAVARMLGKAPNAACHRAGGRNVSLPPARPGAGGSPRTRPQAPAPATRGGGAFPAVVGTRQHGAWFTAAPGAGSARCVPTHAMERQRRAAGSFTCVFAG